MSRVRTQYQLASDQNAVATARAMGEVLQHQGYAVARDGSLLHIASCMGLPCVNEDRRAALAHELRHGSGWRHGMYGRHVFRMAPEISTFQYVNMSTDSSGRTIFS